jgi:hypothetical protein
MVACINRRQITHLHEVMGETPGEFGSVLVIGYSEEFGNLNTLAE